MVGGGYAAGPGYNAANLQVSGLLHSPVLHPDLDTDGDGVIDENDPDEDGGGLTNLPASEVQGLRSGRIIVEVGETQAAHAFAAAYASTPVVVATPRDPQGQHNLAVTLVDVSPSNFVVSVTALDGSAWGDPIEIDWIALGL